MALPSLSKPLTHPICPGRFVGVVLVVMPLIMMVACLTPGDVNLDHLVDIVSVRFLPRKVCIFPCEIPRNQVMKCSCTIKSEKTKLCFVGSRGTNFGIIYAICLFI